MSEQRINELAEKWHAGNASEQEKEEFTQWYQQFNSAGMEVPALKNIEQRLRRRILRATQPAGTVSLYRRMLPYAAAVIILVTGLAYFYNRLKTPAPLAVNSKATGNEEIKAGTNKATLTLSGGQTIQLDATANQLLNAKGIKNNNAVISYLHAGVDNVSHTLSTPRGGQYQLVLSDGTKVWLNAASSITYPAAFSKSDRRVIISGEAYLEVAPHKTKPFIVKTDKDEIKVLGTAFNINNYSNEKENSITLVQGAVSVNGALLKPGEAYSHGVISEADIEHTIAWKNGLTSFKHADIAAIVRQIERWYNVSVECKGVDMQRTFTGEIPRDVNLQSFLKLLSVINIHYTIDLSGKKLSLY